MPSDANAWPPTKPPAEAHSRGGLIVRLVAGAIVLVLIAGAVVVAVARQPASAEGGWLHSDLSGAIFLQLTDVDGQLVGSAQTWRSDDDDLGATGTSESYSLSGLRSNDSLSITLDGPLGGQLTWTGVVAADDLTLQVASDDGGLKSAVFKRSSVDGFNDAVAAGQRAAGERQAAADQQAEEVAEQDQVVEAAADASQAEQRIAADLQRLDEAILDLDGTDLQPQIDEMERRLQAMGGQLDRVLTTSECFAQSDALVALSNGLVALTDARVAFEDARLGATEAIGRAEAAIDDLDEHVLELGAAIDRAGSSAPPSTTSSAVIQQQRDAAQASIGAVSAHADELDGVATGLLLEGESVLDEGQAAIRSCASGGPELAPPAAAGPTSPNAPQVP